MRDLGRGRVNRRGLWLIELMRRTCSGENCEVGESLIKGEMRATSGKE